MSDDWAVCWTDLGHAYTPDRWVFRRCSARVRRGGVFALLGPNGRGKSTLLHAVLGVLAPSEGRVSVRGHVAFVPQLFQVSFDYSALDMVLMGRARHIGMFSQPGRADRDVSLAALARFGLADLAETPFHQLSGGQRQMVIFARALAAESDILILDEPTSSLDLKNQALVLEWMTRLSHDDGLTVLFSTHHPNHAAAVAGAVMLMLDVDSFATGPTLEVLTEERLTRLYGVPLRHLRFDHAGEPMHAFVPLLRG